MQNTYKILSLLLDYPTEELKENLPEIMHVVEEEKYLNPLQRAKLKEFLGYAMALSLPEWQMQYVQLFDFSSNTNLYLFDHVYGDSRERGQAMVDLTEMYAKAGYSPCSNELPDYLPLFLEYLSLLGDAEGVNTLLGEIAHILKNMHKALEKREASYSKLLGILCSLSEQIEANMNKKEGVKV
jgi:nitrate reductase molybdenum cofactor assembly chaperone